MRWSLKELLPGGSAREIEQAFGELEERTAVVEAMRPLLSPGMKEGDFKKLLRAVEDFSGATARLGGYGMLWFSEDTRDQQALAFLGRAEQRLAEAGNRVLFVELWWRALEKKEAERLRKVSGDLDYYLRKQRLFKPYTLSEKEEKVITLKDVNGVNALGRVYDMITNKFVFTLEVDGKSESLTREELSDYVRHPSSRLREAAYRELYRVYGAEATVLGQVYASRVMDWAGENLTLRGFPSPVSVRNLSNDIPDRVVDTLLEVCAEEAGVFHKYFALKAGWIGSSSNKLRRFDLYAPLSGKAPEKIPYSEAVETVLASFGRFSPEMRRMARRVLDEGHMDAELRKGKRGGAFCMSVLPGMAPWVLANYTGEPRQVATIAHELGHAVHSLMAGKHSVLTFHSGLPLAETASVFGEMLLTEALLSREEDPEARRRILADTVDGMYATVLRQAFFVLFEIEAHRMAAGGCTIGELEDAYLKNLSAQFGDSVEVDDAFRQEWISIPHIYHAPFYCYAYSFGMLLSLSLFSRYKEEGEKFVPRFLKILEYGGSESPARILGEAGVDMADAGFWRSGFRVIEDMVRTLS